MAVTAVGDGRPLATAARALLADYARDPELTAFTALDGEDFEGADPQG